MIEHVTVRWSESWCSATEIERRAALMMKNNPVQSEVLEDVTDFNMVKRVVVTLLEHQAHELVYRTPASWWQMFKRDRFPKWALRHWPVQEHIERVIIKDLFPFPTVKYPPPELGPEIRIVRMERIPFLKPNSLPYEEEA